MLGFNWLRPLIVGVLLPLIGASGAIAELAPAPLAPPPLASLPAARSRTTPVLPTLSIHRLPPEVQTTVRLIQRGGPFPYRKDGTVFGNREKRLPTAQRGYYREYTVPTPGASNRGARRLVVGGNNEIYYYTGDHYQSFVRVQL